MQTYAWETFANAIQQLFVSCGWERISIKGLLMEEPEKKNTSQRNVLRIKSDSLFLPSSRARQQASQAGSAYIIQSPRQSSAAQRSRTQPRCQKAALKLHILLQRRHTSPPEPRDTLEILPKACSSPRHAIDTSLTSTRIGLKLVLTLRLFQRKPSVFRCEAAPGRTLGGDGGCLLPFRLQSLPATVLG